MGRPRLDPADQAVQITLPRGVVERIDQHVSDAQYQAFSLIREGKNPFEEPSNSPSRAAAKLRREFIVGLVEKELSFDKLFAVKVSVSAPAGGNSEEFERVAEWMADMEQRLTESAPVPVRKAIERNRVFRDALTQMEAASKED